MGLVYITATGPQDSTKLRWRARKPYVSAVTAAALSATWLDTEGTSLYYVHAPPRSRTRSLRALPLPPSLSASDSVIII